MVKMMRKYCILPRPTDDILKLMVYENSQGVYLFEYDTILDKPCSGDLWFQSITEAEDYIKIEFSDSLSWISIDDPIEYCQDDLVNPVRVKGRNTGSPVRGCYEQLIDGEWKEINLEL
jgi:biofilm protein TabA